MVVCPQGNPEKAMPKGNIMNTKNIHIYVTCVQRYKPDTEKRIYQKKKKDTEKRKVCFMSFILTRCWEINLIKMQCNVFFFLKKKTVL